jgi:uncharacterized protein YndB with AHSA1/START domain
MAQAIDTNEDGAAQQPPPLKQSRILHARRETVFKAWSTAEHVKRWFAPEGCTVLEAAVEMRVGGKFELDMRSPGGTVHQLRGTFVEVVLNTRLVIDMQIADSAGAPIFNAYTEVDFSDALGGTQMNVVQRYTILDRSKAWMVAGAPQGWNSTLDKLEKEVVRMQGGGETGIRSVAHATFQLKRRYDASTARVWKAFTDADAKQKWFSGPPERWELLERHMDVRRRRQRAVKGPLGGWGRLDLYGDLSRRDPERAAGLQLCDASRRQEDLGVAGDSGAEGRGHRDGRIGGRTGRLSRRV